jgi:outer membrane beta-barrel protein
MKRLALILAVVIFPAVVFAQEATLADAPAVRQQKMLRKGRHELTPAFGVTLDQKFNTDLVFSASYEYHFVDFASVGVEIGYGGVGFKTGLTKSIESEARRAEDPAGTTVARSGLGLLALVKMSFVPLGGKIVIAGKALGYADIHITAGVGVGTASYYDWDNPPSAVGLAVLVGGGFRYFPIDLLSLNFDIKDYMVTRALTSHDEKKLTQNPTFMFGISFFLPGVQRTR